MLSSIETPRVSHALHHQPLLSQPPWSQTLTYDSLNSDYSIVSQWVESQASVDHNYLTSTDSPITRRGHRIRRDLITPLARPREGRWLFRNDLAKASTRPPLNPLEFLMKQGQNSLRRRHGLATTKNKKQKPRLSFWLPQESSTNGCNPARGLSAITLLNFLVAATNTITNILDNNNNNDNNNDNNNNNIVNINANNNNNNANNVNNIDFGRRKRQTFQVQDHAAQTSKIQTEVLLAMILALDLTTAVWRTDINATEVTYKEHQITNTGGLEIHKNFTHNVQGSYTEPMHNQEVSNKRSVRSFQEIYKHSTRGLEAQSRWHQFQPHLPADTVNTEKKFFKPFANTNSQSTSEYQASNPPEEQEFLWVHGRPILNITVPDIQENTQDDNFSTSRLAVIICDVYRNADKAGELTGMVLRELVHPLFPVMWSRPMC